MLKQARRALRTCQRPNTGCAALPLGRPAPWRSIWIRQLTKDPHDPRVGCVLVDLDEVGVTIGQHVGREDDVDLAEERACLRDDLVLELPQLLLMQPLARDYSD